MKSKSCGLLLLMAILVCASSASAQHITGHIFYSHVPSPSTGLPSRDLQFLWSDSLNVAYGLPPLSGLRPLDARILDTLGVHLASTPDNIFHAPYSKLAFTWNYFAHRAALYSTDPDDPGFLLGPDSTWRDTGYVHVPDIERQRIDEYIYRPGEAGQSYGMWSSLFLAANEDSITNPGGPINHMNSMMFPGPQPAWQDDTTGLGWTALQKRWVWGTVHEFQHAIPQAYPWPMAGSRAEQAFTELFSNAATFAVGDPDNALQYEVPYAWGLMYNYPEATGLCTNPLAHGINYQNWRLLSAYLMLAFRGTDTTRVFTSDPSEGFGDDLMHRWATTDRLLGSLGRQLSDDACAECATKSYLHTATGDTLPYWQRLDVLLHNFRVANYVDNWSLAEHQYGFAPGFGFVPSLSVGCWRALDGCPNDDVTTLPPILEMGSRLATVDTTFARTRYRAPTDTTVQYPMIIEPFGSEYWVVKASPEIEGTSQDLIVTVRTDSLYRFHTFSVDQETGDTLNVTSKDARLSATVVTYGAALDTLWGRPDLVREVLPTQSLDVDSLRGELTFTVPGFGGDTKAAVVVLTLGDGPEGYFSWTRFLTLAPTTNSLPYRFSAALRRSGAPSVSPVTLVETVGGDDADPAWSPTGQDLALSHTAVLGGSSRIHLVGADGSNLRALDGTASDKYQRRPDWSPRDGLIAYEQDDSSSFSNPQARVVDLGTSTSSAIGLRPATYPTFAPDGNSLVYVHEYVPEGETEFHAQLRRVSCDGTGDTLVIECPHRHVTSPGWTADGAYLVAGIADSVYFINPASGYAFKATRYGIGNDFDVNPGDGRLVKAAFDRIKWRNGYGTAGYSYMPRRSWNVIDTLRSRPVAVGSYRTGWTYRGPRWSPDGLRVAYAASADSTGLGSVIQVQRAGGFNRPPVFTTAPVDTTIAGDCAHSTFTTQYAASDPDGGAVSFRGFGLPPNATLQSNGQFSWPNPQLGSVTYSRIQACDEAGGVAQKVVRFAVAADNTPPATVADFAVDARGRHSISVTWTNVGDDSTTGTACRVRVVYSRNPVIWQDFFALDTMATEPPGEPGTIQCASIATLTSCVPYYFGIRTQDDAGLWGQLATAQGGTRCDGNLEVYCLDSGLMAELESPDGSWAQVGSVPERRGEGATYQILPLPGLVARDGRAGIRLVTRERAWSLQDVQLGFVEHDPEADVVPSGAMTKGAPTSVARSSGATEGQAQEQGSAVHLQSEDAVVLRFPMEGAGAGKVRDYFLLVRGAPLDDAGVAVEDVSIPVAFALHPGQPNPFNQSTRIRFDLPRPSLVRLEVFDLQGRRVARLADGMFPAGRHSRDWDGRRPGADRIQPGVYVYRLQAGTFRAQHKLVLVR